MRLSYIAVVVVVAVPAPAGEKGKATPPDGVRAVAFDTAKCGRTKTGWAVALCTTREQLEQELGAKAGEEVWAQIDPKTEAVAVVGYPDLGGDPKTDELSVRAAKADGEITLRFGWTTDTTPRFTHLMGYEWAGRCKAYAVPRGAAVGLDTPAKGR